MKIIRNIICVLLIFMPLISISAPSYKSKLKKLESQAGDISKLKSSREEIENMLSDSVMMRDAKTHYVAGKIETGAYDYFYKKLSLNRNDASVDKAEMAEALLSVYSHFSKVLQLDSLPDSKGRIRPRYSKDVFDWTETTYPLLYNAGIDLMNKKRYFPSAYNAFMLYAELPKKPNMPEKVTSTSDSVRANSYFYAGVMAFNAGKFEEGLLAFEDSRKLGYKKKEVYLNEMICLQKMAQDKEIPQDSASLLITKLAGKAHSIYGLIEPKFIQKFVAGNLILDTPDNALAAINKSLVDNPDSPLLHFLKADVLTYMKQYEEAEEEYLICAKDNNADFNALKGAAKILIFNGVNRLNEVTEKGKKAKKVKADIKTKYFQPAIEFIRRAKEINNDSELDELMESVGFYNS